MATATNRNDQLFRIEYGHRAKTGNVRATAMDGFQPKAETIGKTPPPPKRFISSIMPPRQEPVKK